MAHRLNFDGLANNQRMRKSPDAIEWQEAEALMTEDTFSKVIEVEREIKSVISDERRRVDQWLQNVKRELSGQYRNELKELREELARSRRAEISEAEDEIRKTIGKARQKAREYEAIDDRELAELLENILQRLVPGEVP